MRAVNERHSPYGYELDHQSLFAANQLDDEGFEVGIYHSHRLLSLTVVNANPGFNSMSADAVRRFVTERKTRTPAPETSASR